VKRLLFAAVLFGLLAGGALASPFTGLERLASVVPTGNGSSSHYSFIGDPQSGSSTHSVTVTWNAAPDATASASYNLYRATGVCPASGLGTLTFTKQVNVSALTATDTAVTFGSYCYYVTHVEGTAESIPSNTSTATIQRATVTIKITIAQ